MYESNPNKRPDEDFQAGEVAHLLAGNGRPEGHGALIRQAVPVERVLMTYLETAAMNHPFEEAEALLLYEPGNTWF